MITITLVSFVIGIISGLIFTVMDQGFGKVKKGLKWKDLNSWQWICAVGILQFPVVLISLVFGSLVYEAFTTASYGILLIVTNIATILMATALNGRIKINEKNIDDLVLNVAELENMVESQKDRIYSLERNHNYSSDY